MFSTVLQHRTLRKNLWLPREKLREIQLIKLKNLVQHAYKRVAYYRQLFDAAGIRPEDIKTLEDLSKIPLTTKEVLKKTPLDQLIAGGVDRNRLIEERTSGSTGKPLVLYQNLSERSYYVLKMLRIFFENGYKITDKTVGIWKEQPFPKRKWFFQKLGFFNWEIISLLLPLEKRIELLIKARPEVLYGANSTLRITAWALLKEGIQIKPPKLLFSTSEVMDERSQSLLTKAFGVVPLNIYGANEVGNIAWECPKRQGLHTNVDSLILEFLKKGKPVAPGEEGKIICTNLHAYTMPLIRYDLGDLCTPSEAYCPCGRTFPLLSQVSGRVDDLITLRDGRLLNRHFFNNFMVHYTEVDEYRVVQEDLNYLRVLFAVKEKHFQQVVDRFKKDFQGVFPPDMRLELERVDEIPQEASGKIRSMLSKVRPEIW